MAQGGAVFVFAPSADLTLCTGSQAHPRGISPGFERADVPFPLMSGIAPAELQPKKEKHI